MLSLCGQNPQIKFVAEFELDVYDMLVCTDVLEHVINPLDLLAQMIGAVRVGGHLLIANCFEPVIACHLPSTFHLRYSFDDFCSRLGLRFVQSRVVELFLPQSLILCYCSRIGVFPEYLEWMI